MTPSQLSTVATAINADATMTASVAAHDWPAIAANANGAGGGTIWRNDIKSSELVTAIVWSEYSAMSVALQNTFQAMIAGGTIDATNTNIRTGFNTIFAGSPTTLANLTALAKRVPTKFEQWFTTNNVSSMYGQTISAADVQKAMGG
jgi:hypothetical protein